MILPRAVLLMALAGVVAVHGLDYPYCGEQTNVPQKSPNTPPPLPDGYHIVSANIVIRHGDRTQAVPGKCWANDNVIWNCSLSRMELNYNQGFYNNPPSVAFNQQYQRNKETIPGNCGRGQLTQIGYYQHISNGAGVYETYVKDGNLLPTSLSGALPFVHLRADQSDRTIASAQALFTGMYPEAENSATAFVDFYTRDDTYETINVNPGACPLLSSVATEFQNSPEFKQLINNSLPLSEKLASILGGNQYTYLPTVFDCIGVHVCHGFDLPAGLSDDLVMQVYDFVTKYGQLEISYNNSIYSRLGMGPLLTEIVDRMEDNMRSASAVRLAVYGGHDTSLLPLLGAFDIFDGAWPKYASLMSIELLANYTGSYSVRVVYNGKAMQLPDCETTVCTWAEWIAIVQPMIDLAAKECVFGPDMNAAAAPSAPMGFQKRALDALLKQAELR